MTINVNAPSPIASNVVESANVVVDQFSREFTAILQLTREKQSKDETFAGLPGVKTPPRREVSCYGNIAQKLVPLVNRVMRAAPEQLNSIDKMTLLVKFGDKFYQCQEYCSASMFFYVNVFKLDNKESAFLQKDILASIEIPSKIWSRVEGQAYVRSLFGIARSYLHAQKRSDELMRYPGSLEKVIEAMTLLRRGIEIAMAMEGQHSGQFLWLMLNGTVLTYSIAKPLQTLGFSKEVVTYLKYSLLAMESQVALCTTKYIMWRLQLGSAICDCYQDLALKEAANADRYNQSAVACALYLQRIVQRLRKEEELDMPLPDDVQQILLQAERSFAMLKFRLKAAVAHEPLTTIVIESAFPALQDQLRAAIDAIETTLRRDHQKRGGHAMFALTPAATPSGETLELFNFVMTIVAPMLTPLVENEEAAATRPLVLDKATFPIFFHLITIRTCFELAQTDERMDLLIRSARRRIQDASDTPNAVMIKYVVELYEALHNVQQSWFTWDALSNERRLESTVRVQLPVSGGTIPSFELLTSLSNAVQNCVNHGNGEITRSNHDLLTRVALQMWREVGIAMLEELDNTEMSRFSKSLVCMTSELLLTIHTTFIAVKFDDLLLHGHICLRLATLLSIEGEAHRGSQVVRQCLDQIDSRRCKVVEFSSHFHSVVDKESTANLSKASFSCKVSDMSGSSTGSANAREHVGVRGTGSQLGSLHQDLCCLQVDLLLSMYRLELQAAKVADTLSPSTAPATPGALSSKHTVRLATEAKLVKECHQNGYMKVLFNIQRLALSQKSVKWRTNFADESLQLLQQMADQEDKLCRQLTPSLALTTSVVPVAPIVISRSSLAITVQVVTYRPSHSSLQTKRVQYYMVFAKPAGAGTAVSLNSNQLPGTATPIYPPHLNAKISGLLPNESYVFAVAAFDCNDKVIHGIGETSEPVVALNPLPLPMCYGYLAQACYDGRLIGQASHAAKYLYGAVISTVSAERPLWMANPFYRQAIKREVVAQFPKPILNLCIQALLILCHNEPGDHNQDGRLVTPSDINARSLTTTQVKALEDARKISIAIEIACSTDNQEAIRVLCFKGYRLLLPLLHLKGCCNGLTFAALVTYYLALKVIPGEKWDVDTQQIHARIGFELYRIAKELHGDIARVTLPLVFEATTRAKQALCDESNSLVEVLALFQFATSAQFLSETMPVTTNSPRNVSAKGATTQGGSKGNLQLPIQKKQETDSLVAREELESLSDLLQLAENDPVQVFSMLQQQSLLDRRAIEFASKISWTLLESGNQFLAQISAFLTSLKATGEVSSQFRETLSLVGGAFLLPELVDVNAAKSSSDQGTTTSETAPSEDVLFKPGVDDDYLLRWCGELFFIQCVILYRKIAWLSNTIDSVDAARGPTEDCTYDLLHSNDDDCVDHIQQDGILATASVSNAQPILLDSSVATDDNQLEQLFGDFLEKSAACCKLFRLAKCWQGLRAAAQQLWNAIWLAWVSPTRFSALQTWQKHLLICIEALLDMKACNTNVLGDQNVARSSAAFTRTSTDIAGGVHADADIPDVDQTWFARLMTYSFNAFCSFKDWKSIVEIGGRYHSLCGHSSEDSQFSEHNFLIIIYAQEQLVSRHEALLTAAKEELNAFVTEFQEKGVKEKKKKTRLVMEEKSSSEETAFHANKQEREQRLQRLTIERDSERKNLLQFEEIHEGLAKVVCKSQHTLHACHQLITKYFRLDQHNDTSHQAELVALRRQIIALFKRCVTLARQKCQKRQVCQALQELGDFYLAYGDLKAAIKSWLESLDNAFETINICASWREVLVPAAPHSVTSKDLIAGDELWVGLQSCSVLSKLMMHSSGVEMQETVNYALMAAATFTRFYGCSIPHPAKHFLFGSYRMRGQLWPGREIFSDPDRMNPFSLTTMLILVPETLLQYEHQYAFTAMPVITGYEYVAETCLCDANHIANARRFRVEALLHCGRFQEAWQVLMELLRGGTTPCDSTGALEQETITFHDGKPLVDVSNQAALNWFKLLKVKETETELRKHYPMALVVHILALILQFATALARHEDRYDRNAAIVRSAAKNMAYTLLTLLNPSVATPMQTTKDAIDGKRSEDAPPFRMLQSLLWEDLQLHRIRANIHLHLSRLAFYEGDWNASKTSSMNAIEEYDAICREPVRPLRLDLDQKLAFSLLISRSTFVAKCQSQAAACCLAQVHHREIAQSAIYKTCVNGEEHIRQQLELQRLQAAVFLGDREKTEQKLFALKQEALAAHTSLSLTYTRTLQALSSLLRSNALFSNRASDLKAVEECLSEAAKVLGIVLAQDGWTGVHLQENDRRLNLYRPAIPDFVQVHADLVQVLLECPLNLECESVQTRHARALQSVGIGIRSLEHTTRRMFATKARLLLFKGILLSKTLLSSTALRGSNDNVEQRFKECVSAFVSCIVSSIEGGYDRHLVRIALVQLVDLYNQKVVPSDENAHVQAAFHYLQLALAVQKHEFVLFDTLELQNGTITSVDQLPASIRTAINAQSDAPENDCSPPLTEKAPDADTIVNFFVRLLRMQHILPVATRELQDTSAFLHCFLMEHHSAYTRVACLTKLPPVPSTDPEICAGLVCGIWGQDLAPALTSSHNTELTFYFTLGTSNMSIYEDSTATGSNAAIDRMKKFSSVPLLSKRSKLNRQSVQSLKAALSKLRLQVEDNNSLLIDRTTFPHMFHLTLCEIQQLFCGTKRYKDHSRQSQADPNTTESAGDLCDVFGNTISIECTLETIRRLENLFSIKQGAHFVDNELCFFLRDLLNEE